MAWQAPIISCHCSIEFCMGKHHSIIIIIKPSICDCNLKISYLQNLLLQSVHHEKPELAASKNRKSRVTASKALFLWPFPSFLQSLSKSLICHLQMSGKIKMRPSHSLHSPVTAPHLTLCLPLLVHNLFNHFMQNTSFNVDIYIQWCMHWFFIKRVFGAKPHTYLNLFAPVWSFNRELKNKLCNKQRRYYSGRLADTPWVQCLFRLFPSLFSESSQSV